MAQAMRNLVFIGRCFAANNMMWKKTKDHVLEEDDGSEGERTLSEDYTALAYLFNRLSYIIRQESLPVSGRTAAVQCQTALLKVVDTIPNLQSVLRPLHSLTDTSIAQPSFEAYKNLTEKARELLDLIQAKVGTEAYIQALGPVRTEARQKRDERRQKRRIDAVSEPERWAKEKKRKHEGHKASLKARALESRGKRRGW